MKRRIVLIDLFWTRDKDPRVPLGHASILAALRAAEGLEVRSVILPVNDAATTPARIAQDALREAAGCAPRDVDLAFGAYVWGEHLLVEALRLVRAAGFQGRILLGGPQISYSGPGLERLYPEADGFIRGYAEEALGRVAASAERLPIQGVHWAGAPDLQQQAAVDLEALPSPWLTGLIPLARQRFIRWETQRGCPFACSFCQHREAGQRLSRHALHLPRIEAEIDLFCASGVREIAVLDPIFSAAPHAVGVLERFASRGFTGRLALQCRAEQCGEEFLDAAARLDVLLEFGLQTIHQAEGRAIRRINHMPRVEQALAGARARGLPLEVSLIFGLPLQTLRSFEESVAWCLERQVPVIKAFPLLLLRGTKLDRDRQQWGLVASDDPMARVESSDTFSPDDWRAMAALSEALKATEGAHPASIEGLWEVARGLEPDLARWSPLGAAG